MRSEITKLPKASYMNYQILVYNDKGQIVEDCQILGDKRDAEHELRSILKYLEEKEIQRREDENSRK